MEHQLILLLAWIEPHAVWMALAGPVLARLVGHWFPEELFMMALGAIAAASGSPLRAAELFAAVWLGHFLTDQAVYLAGIKLKPRLERSPRFAASIGRVTSRLERSPGALLGLIPARVLPLGRGAWLAACGMVGIGWNRFVTVDAAALVIHVSLWCGLGWWMGGELAGLVVSAEIVKTAALWGFAALLTASAAILAWRRRDRLAGLSQRVFSRQH